MDPSSPAPHRPHAQEIHLLEEIEERCQRLLAHLPPPALEELAAIRHAAQAVKCALLQPTPDSTPLPESLHILLVEDNLMTQKLLARLLEQRGHRLRAVANGALALQALNEERFDLVLMDLRMPTMDGWQTASAIRQREISLGGEQHLPIIAVTALTGGEERDRALASGMDGFHGKPVRAEALFAEMERVLQRVIPMAAPPPPPQDEVRVDVDRLMQSVDGDACLLREVVELYRSDAPRLLQQIREGIVQGHPPQVREAAHSLKGATGAFGKNLVYELSFALEQAGQAGEIEKAQALLPRLMHALERMNSTLDRTLADLGA